MGVHPHRRGHRHRHRSLLLRHITADRVCSHPPCAKSARRVYYLAGTPSPRRKPSAAPHPSHFRAKYAFTTKAPALNIQAARNVAFLLYAKGSENAQGEFSEYPPGNPKTPHTPTSERQSEENRSPPYLRGQKRNVSKRIKDKGKIHTKSRSKYLKRLGKARKRAKERVLERVYL